MRGMLAPCSCHVLRDLLCTIHKLGVRRMITHVFMGDHTRPRNLSLLILSRQLFVCRSETTLSAQCYVASTLTYHAETARGFALMVLPLAIVGGRYPQHVRNVCTALRQACLPAGVGACAQLRNHNRCLGRHPCCQLEARLVQ